MEVLHIFDSEDVNQIHSVELTKLLKSECMPIMPQFYKTKPLPQLPGTLRTKPFTGTRYHQDFAPLLPHFLQSLLGGGPLLLSLLTIEAAPPQRRRQSGTAA